MHTVAVILARAGSKGLPDKCVLPLCGRPVVAYTIEHAKSSRCIDHVLLTTDSTPIRRIARRHGVDVIERPQELADDTATVDAAARHAITEYERERGAVADVVVLLYGNVPVRAPDIIDRVVEHLVESGATSVRTVAPIGRHHPDWVHHLDDDRLRQFRPNSVYRRQDLEPLYYHDGAVAAVTRSSLFSRRAQSDPQGFWGADCRAIVQEPADTVDIDELADFYYAEALIRLRSEQLFLPRPRATAGERGILTGAAGYARHARR